jgi:WD40 repeat protein
VTDKEVTRLVGNDDGSVVAVVLADGGCRVAKVGQETVLYTVPADLGAVSLAQFSPDGKQLAVAGSGWVATLDAESGRVLAVRKAAHKGAVTAITFTPDSGYLVTGGADGRVRFWEGESAKAVSEVAAHGGTVTGLGFSPEGKQLVTGSADKSVKVWEFRK